MENINKNLPSCLSSPNKIPPLSPSTIPYSNTRITSSSTSPKSPLNTSTTAFPSLLSPRITPINNTSTSPTHPTSPLHQQNVEFIKHKSTPLMNYNSPIASLLNDPHSDETPPIENIIHFDVYQFLQNCIHSKFFIQHPWIPIIVNSLINGDTTSSYHLLDIISEQDDFRFDKYNDDEQNEENDTMNNNYKNIFQNFHFYLQYFCDDLLIEFINPVDLFMLITSSIIICNTIHTLETSSQSSIHTLCAICHIFKIYCLPSIIQIFAYNNKDRNLKSSRVSTELMYTNDTSSNQNPSKMSTLICDIPFFHLNVCVAHLLEESNSLEDTPFTSVSLNPTNSSISEYLNTALAVYLSISLPLHSCGIRTSDGILWEPLKRREFEEEVSREETMEMNIMCDESTDEEELQREQLLNETKDVLHTLLNCYFFGTSEINHLSTEYYEEDGVYTSKQLEILFDFLQIYLINSQKQFINFCIHFHQNKLIDNSDVDTNKPKYPLMDPLDPSVVYAVYSNLWDSVVMYFEVLTIADNTTNSKEWILKIYGCAVLQKCMVNVLSTYWYIFGTPSNASLNKIGKLLEKNDVLIANTGKAIGVCVDDEETVEVDEFEESNKFELSEDTLVLHWIRCVHTLCVTNALLKTIPSCIRASPQHSTVAGSSDARYTFSILSDQSTVDSEAGHSDGILNEGDAWMDDNVTLGDITEGSIKRFAVHKKRIAKEAAKLKRLVFSDIFKICNDYQRDWMWLDRDELWFQCLQSIMSAMLSSGSRICDIEDVIQMDYKTVVSICQSRSFELNVVISGWQVAAYRICLLIHQFELVCVMTELCRWNYLFESLSTKYQDDILLSLVELDVCLVKLLLVTSNYAHAEIISENIKKRVGEAAGFPHFRSYCLMLIIDCMLYSSWLDSFLSQYNRSLKYSNGEETEDLKNHTLPVATRHAYEALYHLMLQFHRATAIAMRDVYVGIKGFIVLRPIPGFQETPSYNQIDRMNVAINDIFIMQAVAVAVQAQLVLSQSLPLCCDSLLWYEKVHSEGDASLKALMNDTTGIGVEEEASIDFLITSRRVSTALEQMGREGPEGVQPLTVELLNDVAYWLCENAKQQLKWMTNVLYKLGHRELLAVCFILECNILPDTAEQPEVQTANKANLVFQLGGMNPFFKHKAAQALLNYKSIPLDDWMQCQREAMHLKKVIYTQISAVTSSDSEMWSLLKHIGDGRSNSSVTTTEDE